MFDNITGLGYGIITLAILLIVGTVVVNQIGDTTALCNSGTFTTYNASLDLCQNSSGSTATPQGTAWTTGNYLEGQLGSTTGLASWVPAIIAVAIGFIFLAYFGFGGRKGK